MKAFVTEVSGPPFAKDAEGHSIQAGDQAGLLLVAEPPREDRVFMLMGCEACGFKKGSTLGSHGHRYHEEQDNQLSVQIGRPQSL